MTMPLTWPSPQPAPVPLALEPGLFLGEAERSCLAGASVAPLDGLEAIIAAAACDPLLPFRDALIEDLNYLMEPDPMDDGDPFSPEALKLFLRFMKKADWLTEPPRLTAGVNGGLGIGWEKSKENYFFVYFMRSGEIQFVAKHPDFSHSSGRLAQSLDEIDKMEPLAAAYRLFCMGDAHGS
ncbi:MAG: hypothetical protein HQL91_07315 [Magnetococcales bacterium]|nr:hypothetical protein [Magnetococcales bacterium]